jgi:hypothetical protein
MPFKSNNLVRVGSRWRRPEVPPPEPPPPPPPRERASEDDLTWMIADSSPARRVAFLQAIGGRFAADPPATTAWVLNRWSEASHGLRWVLDPGAPAQVTVPSARAEQVLAHCFANVREGLTKRAQVECQGDLEWAIQKAVDEQMTMYGLDHLMGVGAS